MVWGVGFGDIIVGAQLAYQIYIYGFTEDNAADERYKLFHSEISILGSLLRKLDEALRAAHDRYQKRHRDAAPLNLHLDAYDPISTDFETERRHLVGDFHATLQECDALLRENKEYRTRYSSFAENLKWHLSQQEQRVDRLRQRVRFHCEKIRFVIDRLSVNLLTDIDAKVDDILALSQQTLQNSEEIKVELARFRATLFGHLAGHCNLVVTQNADAHPIGGRIARRFQEYLSQDCPSNFDTGIPLIEGFDTLLLHFDRSRDRSAASIDRYLAFLKAKWLLGEIKGGQEFEKARPGLYYKRAINQIEQAILTKPRQSDGLIPYDEAALLALPSDSYRIWPPATVVGTTENIPPHPLMAAAHEEQVLRLESEVPGSLTPNSIVIFRSSASQFRIVQQTMGVGLPGNIQPMPYLKESPPILCNQDKLIPRYAQPSLSKPELEIVVSARGWEMPYKFASMDQLHRFQGALMGYTISHSQERLRFQFDGAHGFGDGKGRAQLWQEPIVLRSGATPTNPSSQLTTPPNSRTGGSHSRHDSAVPSLTLTTTINETATGWEAQALKSSALVIFTQATTAASSSSRPRRKPAPRPFATIFLDLAPGIFIDHNECRCPQIPMHQSCPCLSIILTRKAKPDDLREFVVRVAHSETDAQGNPNVNTFDLFPFRVPRHPDFERLKVHRTKYFALQFPNMQEKRVFHDELMDRIRVREGQRKDQRDFDRTVLAYENQVRRGARDDDGSKTGPAGGRSCSLPSSLALPPELAVRFSGSDFAESVTRGLDRCHISDSAQDVRAMGLDWDQSEGRGESERWSHSRGFGRNGDLPPLPQCAGALQGSPGPSPPIVDRDGTFGSTPGPSMRDTRNPDESSRRRLWPRRGRR